jgi:quinol monooxygenase YgiN
MAAPIVIDANVFVSRWFVAPAHRDEFIRQFNLLWQANVDGLKQATNFIFYGWGRDPNEFVAIESWKDEATVAALRQSEDFKTAVASLMACCDRSMEMQLYSGMQAPRDVFASYQVGPSSVHPTSGAIGAVFL